jgi:hypothetical protein
MSEAFPAIPPHVRVISVVIAKRGYQAMVEVKEEIAFHPYWRTITRVARAETICKAIEAALNGQRLQNRSVS